MKGRKRKPGRRGATGRLIQVQNDWAIMAPVLTKRCSVLGWEPTQENMRRVRGHEGGTTWGLLYLVGAITREQYETAIAFAILRADWLRSIAAPRLQGSDMDPDNRGQSLEAENVRRVRAVRAAYLAADRALRNAGVLPTRAVFRVLDGQAPDVEMLRVGLDALRGRTR